MSIDTLKFYHDLKAKGTKEREARARSRAIVQLIAIADKVTPEELEKFGQKIRDEFSGIGYLSLNPVAKLLG